LQWAITPRQTIPHGGNALILDPKHENDVLCQFVLGGRKVVSPQRILREKFFNTISRQQACKKASHPSLLTTHNSFNRLDNAVEKSDLAPQFVLSIKN
jgi:hypothetical protein